MEEDGGGPRRVPVRVAKATFRVGQHVRNSKEKMRFAKATEQNFSTKVFRVAEVIEGQPRADYDLDYLNGTPIDGQLYREELTPVSKADGTAYKIDKILDKRVRRGIREYLVH